jgi:ParB family transcriptional regulator, chromosome partitioning protein
LNKVDAANAELREVPVELIDKNPENPRLVFRSHELETLQESISRYGVQVPISVFKKGRRYILIDGERRWRCSLKLNKKTIPALVQEEPDQLTNLLLMFNIHALREEWDLLTIAFKLPRTIELLEKRLGKAPKEAQIAAETGLTRSVIRRCKLLMELPDRYRNDLLDELHKPKAHQKLTEDLFIEMERALKTVERAMPGSIEDKNEVRDVLIEKYRNNIIKDITDFRYLPKISKAEKVHADTAAAARSIKRVFNANNYSIEQAYIETVSEAYSERDLVTRVDQLMERLEEIDPKELDDAVVNAIRRLVRRLNELLRIAR